MHSFEVYAFKDVRYSVVARNYSNKHIMRIYRVHINKTLISALILNKHHFILHSE